ncbi:hypothetical protein D3C78_1630830 [compost metagenome]
MDLPLYPAEQTPGAGFYRLPEETAYPHSGVQRVNAQSPGGETAGVGGDRTAGRAGGGRNRCLVGAAAVGAGTGLSSQPEMPAG